MRKTLILGAILAALAVAVAVPAAFAGGSGSGSVATRATDDRGRHVEPGDDHGRDSATVRHRSHEHHHARGRHGSRRHDD